MMGGRYGRSMRGGGASSSAGGRFGGGLAEPNIRINFPDTALWMPSVRTGKDGLAKISFRLPDSITSYRMTARGVTLDGIAGEARGNIVAKQDFFVNLRTPQFFVSGDEAVITAHIFNYTSGEKVIDVALEGQGFEIVGPPPGGIRVTPSQPVAVDWRIRVTSKKSVEFRVKAGSDDVQDAMGLTVPVEVAGREVRQVISDELNFGETAVKFEIPSEALLETARLDAQLLPFKGPLYGLIQTLSYLAEYPHGCVEQTMSRFGPNIAVHHTLKNLRISTGAMPADLPKMVEAGAKRLYGFQKKDGGWGWFENDQTDSFMTAYVVNGLKLAQTEGFAIDANSLASGVKSLKEQLKTVKDENKLAFMHFALSQFPEETDVPAFTPDVTKLSSYALACYGLCLNNRGEEAAGDVVKLLEKSAIRDASGAHWETQNWYYKWENVDVETTAYCLKAVCAIAPESPVIPDAVTWLMSRRNGNKWGSTKDSAAAILALVSYFENSDGALMKLSAEMDAAATKPGSGLQSGKFVLNGGEPVVLSTDLASPFENRNYRIFEAKHLRIGTNTALLDASDSGLDCSSGKVKPGYLLRLSYQIPEDPGAAVSNGLGVSTDVTEGALNLEPGAVREIAVTVEADADCNYVLVSSPIPAGCEVLEGSEAGSHTFFERRFDRALFFVRDLPKGRHVFRYSVKANYPGAYSVLPADAYLMYNESVNGKGTGWKCVIAEKK
jgi:uncharacterized protein YfaS (alpha-2-macroglobulin family)